MAFFGMALPSMDVCNVFARAGTGVGQALGQQTLQCLLVRWCPLGLPQWRRIGVQAAGSQLLQDGVRRAGGAARCVHIFDAYQPAPTVAAIPRAGIKPTSQRCHQGASMKRPRGGRGKAAYIERGGAHGWLGLPLRWLC